MRASPCEVCRRCSGGRRCNESTDSCCRWREWFFDSWREIRVVARAAKRRR